LGHRGLLDRGLAEVDDGADALIAVRIEGKLLGRRIGREADDRLDFIVSVQGHSCRVEHFLHLIEARVLKSLAAQEVSKRVADDVFDLFL
jgi:hypothetical protein